MTRAALVAAVLKFCSVDLSPHYKTQEAAGTRDAKYNSSDPRLSGFDSFIGIAGDEKAHVTEPDCRDMLDSVSRTGDQWTVEPAAPTKDLE
jgi:hypothetical protein